LFFFFFKFFFLFKKKKNKKNFFFFKKTLTQKWGGGGESTNSAVKFHNIAYFSNNHDSPFPLVRGCISRWRLTEHNTENNGDQQCITELQKYEWAR